MMNSICSSMAGSVPAATWYDLGVPSMRQIALLPELATRRCADPSSGSFVSNMTAPVHRWFRYSAGFDGAWAESLIESEARRGEVRVLDPFAGCGTTLIAAEQCSVESCGIDSHPFVAKVARAKLAYRSSPSEYGAAAEQVLASAKRMQPDLAPYAPLIHRCYSEEALGQLDCLRRATEVATGEPETALLVWLTLVAILRATSHVGTANWQYLLPDRRKVRVEVPFEAFREMAHVIRSDMETMGRVRGPRARFAVGDARSCDSLPADGFNLVVTSPPYANNYDYADATRLELTFFGEVQGWGDLQKKVRQHLLRSCTQHVPNKAVDLDAVLDSPELTPIGSELRNVCERLSEIRLSRGGKKTYHNMVACYFLDLARVWLALRRVCRSPSKVCFVIGDSAPYGVYVPAVEWLGELALAAGFDSVSFEKTRDRNTKWKNRKHRVPLCEGRLWVMG